MSFIERASIKRKQVLIVMLITSVALLLACAAFGAYEVLNFRKTMLRNLTTLAEIVGNNSAVALDFDDPRAAEETLASLRVEPNILGACIYDKSGRVFAQFKRAGGGQTPKVPPFQLEGHAFSRDNLTLFRPIDYKGDVVGAVYIVSDMGALYSRLERYGAIAGGVFGVSMLIALVLSARLQRLVSDPILRLVQTTRSVARDKDYSIRVARHSQDEIGELIDGFNEMLTQIQERDAVLQNSQSELEQRVRDRTQELAGSLSLVHATLESTADGILVADGAGKPVNWNKRFMTMWQMPSAVMGTGDEQKMTEAAAAQLKSPEQFTAKLEQLYGHPEMESSDVLEFKDGRVFERYSKPQRIGEKCVGRVWSFRDVTDRKRAEQHLQTSLEQLRWKTALFEALVNSSPDGILVVDDQGKKILQTQRTNELWKIPQEMIENQNDAEQVKFVAESTRDPEQFRNKVLYLYSHPEVTSRDEIEFKDGRILERYSAPVLSVDKKYYGRIWSFRDITERKLVEAELDYERELLRSLLNNSPDHIYFKDRESRFIKCSQKQAERYKVKSVEEVIGKTDRDFFDEAHARKALADEQEIIRTGCPMLDQVEKVVRKGEGRVAWSLTNKMPLRNKAGEVIGTFGISKDITAMKLVEAELAAERDLLGMLMENSPDMIYFKDRESRFLRASKAFADRLDSKRPDEIAGKTDFEIYSEEHARPAYEDEQEIIRTGKPLIGKIEKETWQDGRVTWVLTSKMPLRDKDGEIVGTFGISKDITVIKQVEAELAAERDLLGALLENSPDMIYFKDRQSRFVRASKALAERHGVKGQDEVLGKNDFDFFSDEHARPAYEDEQEIIRTGKPLIGKIEKETWQDGRLSWVLTSKMPLRNKDGEITGTFGISKDITAIKQVEAELAAERDLLGTLLENSPDMIYFKDRESRFLRSSKTHVHRMGKARYEEVVGKTDFDFFSEEHARPAYEDERRIIQTGQPLIGKIEKETWENGQSSWVLTSKMPLRDTDGNIIGTFGISKDISAIKEAEIKLEEVHRRLLETSRMAGMAEVATSVLHNVGNVLNSVNVSCSVVTDRVHKSKVVNLTRAVALIDEHGQDLAGFFAADPKGKQLPAYLKGVAAHLATEQEEILQELANLSHNIDHIKEIVAMQQSYSKVSGVRELLPAMDLVEDALRMNGAAFERHQVKVIREYSAVPPVMAEKHKVLQILINLLRNAKYACDDGGRAEKQVTLRLEAAGGLVKISIIDNGVGIPKENLTRIFEHGFTTRKEGHGFGLHSGALAAQELGGSLGVTSDGPGRGACFTLELPCQPTERDI